MRVRTIILAATVLLLLAGPILALDFLYPAEVERVIDGDTIVVDLHLGLDVVLDNQYIRFYGIDAWETRGEERGERATRQKVCCRETGGEGRFDRN